jgi:Transmembrane domain of unknown function (DUF3566)
MSTDQPAPPSIPPRAPAPGQDPGAGHGPQGGAGGTAVPGRAQTAAPTSTAGVPAQERVPVRTTTTTDDTAPSAARARAAAAGGAAAGMAGRVLRGVTTAVTGTAPGGATSAPDRTTTASGTPSRGTTPEGHPSMATDTSTRPAQRPAPTPAPARDAAPRRVRLSLSRVDPWSVMKLSFLLSFAIGIMIVVAAAVIWMVLDSLAVFTTINDMIREIVGDESPIDILQFVDFTRVVSGAMVIAIVDVILLTALSTIGAFLYNITAALVGGVNVTLTDE